MTRLAYALALVLIIAPFAGAQTGEFEHEFSYKPDGNPSKVAVAGDFNNWSTDVNPMTKGADGVWYAKLKLPEGVQHYKFVVDGNQWKTDPNGDKSLESDDNYGGKNSGIFVGPDGRKLAPPRSEAVNPDAVAHDPNNPRDCSVFAPGSVLLMIRTQADDVQQVSVQYYPDDGQAAAPLLSAPMYKLESKYGFERWGTALTGLKSKGIAYSFALTDGGKTFLFDTRGKPELRSTGGGNLSFPFKRELKPTFETPDWAKHAVWYQIFPERFRNGDPSNDPNDHDYEHVVKWTGDWWKTQEGETPGQENFYKGKGNVWKRRYGGDVQGLIQSLPYLRKLGINAIYLNPIFEADSMHKYDTSDYRHVDDNFGFKGDIAALQGETDDPSTWQWTKTDKLFLDFVQQAHAMGFKVILDGVFNHVGKSHPFFQDVLKNGKSSKYADWFEVTDWNSTPIKYKSWDGDGHLPVLRKDAARGLAHGPREHVLAVVKRWLAPDGDPTKGIDGWRLDVPGDIPRPFWVEFRKVVKETKPDAYISGEIWTWAQPWLQGDQFDAVMNYRWADAAQQFFVNQKNAIPPSKFNQQLNQIAYSYPFQVSLVQQNLFDSHDTDRFASMFVNPDLAYDAANRIQDNGPNYKPDKPTAEQWTRMEQAVAAQMTFLGAPMIYYGDEAGMWSPDDPSNRQPMVWPGMKFDNPQVGFNPEIFAFYQRAIALRQKLPELQLGFFRGVLSEDEKGVYAFARDLGEKHAYVVINRSGRPRTVELPIDVANGTKLVNWLDPAQTALKESDNDRPRIEMKSDMHASAVTGGKFTITLKPFTTAVLASN
jgi:cyclomaltodextrinase / maltogenic alpha-amylase / neopullulanase